MYKDILGQAEQYLNVSEVERVVNAIKDFIPSIVQLNKAIYEEMLKQGFSEAQAFKFSCDYTMAAIFQGK